LNTSWVPKVKQPGDIGSPSDCPQGAYDPLANPDRPMLCANWCKAKAYCAWAGKRLCGKIGGGKLAEAFNSVATDPTGEWYNACSQRGKTVYSFGDQYDAAACDGPDNVAGTMAPLPASAMSACHGTTWPFDQILNMSGSVYEWDDSCVPDGFTVDCRIRGGSYLDNPKNAADVLKCGRAAAGQVMDTSAGTGIRCCAD
jgi:sulfatase modifying factor 1